MVDSENGRTANRSDDGRVTRRRMLKATAAGTGIGVHATLAGCISTDDGDGDGGDGADDGDDGDDGDGEQITLEWAASEQEAEVADQIVDALHEAGLSENVDIDFLAGGDVSDQRRDQYQRWLSSGRATPDLLRMDNGWTIPFIAREQIQNLSEELSDDTLSKVREDYFEMAVATATGADDDLYALPLWVGLPTMMYNKEYLREAGYDDSDFEEWATESMSWQEFSEAAAEARDAAGVDYGYTFQADVYEGLSCCNFNEFMTSWGGAYFGDPEENLFGPVGDRPVTVDEEPVLDAIRMVRSFIHGADAENSLDDVTGDIAPDAVLQWNEPTSEEPFAGGDTVMHRNWPYAVNVYGSEDELGEDLGVMPIPYGVSEEEAEYPLTGGPVAALGGWHLAVNPNSEYLDAAIEVVETAATEEFSLRLFEILGQIPPQPGVFDREEAQDIEPMGRYLDTLRVAGENAVPRPVTVAWPQESGKISQRVHAAFTGDQAPEEAMSALTDELEDIEESSAEQGG